MAIIGAMLVRNEADRWLRDVLQEMKKVCKEIIILDDCSTDTTVQICEEEFGCRVLTSETPLWGVNELIQRKRLFSAVMEHSQNGDWILNLDADEIPTNIEFLPTFIHSFCDGNSRIDGVNFRLFDMWDDTHFREDNLWNAHARNWNLCAKLDHSREYRWKETPLHCGRFPLNASVAPLSQQVIKIRHMGWSRIEERERKYSNYMNIDPNGAWGILAQYKSILDEVPNLRIFES